MLKLVNLRQDANNQVIGAYQAEKLTGKQVTEVAFVQSISLFGKNKVLDALGAEEQIELSKVIEVLTNATNGNMTRTSHIWEGLVRDLVTGMRNANQTIIDNKLTGAASTITIEDILNTKYLFEIDFIDKTVEVDPNLTEGLAKNGFKLVEGKLEKIMPEEVKAEITDVEAEVKAEETSTEAYGEGTFGEETK